MKLHPLLLSLAVLVLVGCSDDATVLPDTTARDAIVDKAGRDTALDGPVVDLPRDAAPQPDLAPDLSRDTAPKPDIGTLDLAPDGPAGDSAACVTEGGKFTDFNTAGKCCGTLVPVVDAVADGKGGCGMPNCPCYVCTKCGDGSCGPGENYCNCPADCPKPLTAAVTNEVWYQGNTTCTPASMALTASTNTITVTLSQIPFAQVPGTCAGHGASVTQAGSTLQLSLTKTGGGACWTACWDFVVAITVPPGSYTVTYLSFTDTITVP